MNKVFYLSKGTQDETIVAALVYFVRHLNQERKWKVVISENKPDRSAAQNRLYWVYVTIISASLGYSKDEMHEVFKLRILAPILLRDDEDFRAVWGAVEQPADDSIMKAFIKLLSTRDLSLSQFAEYLQDIELFAIGMSIILPSRDDDWYMALGQREK